MQVFNDVPGYLFVVATLLPLASFLVLLLASGAWALARRYGWEGVEKALGSADAGKAAAYVAIGAIALAFVCSLIGFLQYQADREVVESGLHAVEKNVDRLKGLPKRLAAEEKELKQAQAAVAELAKDREKSEELEKAQARRDGLQESVKKLQQQMETREDDLKAAEHAHHEIEELWGRTRKAKWEGTLYEVFRLHSTTSYDPNRSSVVSIGFKIDSLSALMFVMVTFVATLIHLFSSGYMSEELSDTVEDHHVHGPHHHAVGVDSEDPVHGHGHGHQRRGRFSRFFMYLSLFCFSMLNLVLADNLFQVFVSWELVGVCSFLLIGFYFERQSASNAANKAFITNRVGDAGFILGLLIVWGYLGTFNFDQMFAQVRHPVTPDAHGTVSKFAGRIVRGEFMPDSKEPRIRVSGPGEGGSQALLFPTRLVSEHLNEKEQAELLDLRRRLTDTTDPAERARLERTIAAKNPEENHFHAAGRGSRVAVQHNRLPEEYGTMPYWMLVAAGLGIFLGCVGKSAQFPLQVWLPDAMEGPTPVSALIHAATMVAAGVYLVGRCFPLFTPEVLLVISYVGAITLFVAATIAIVVTDIKKVLAYSTVSQLGYMMLALGLGGWAAGLFHLITHAVFKALMFLASGSVIYGCHHEQEMTKMGGLYPKMKITALTMLMGVLAIAGVPLFSGWYSKDAIIAQAFGYAYVHREHALLLILPLVTAGITTFYMFRMWFMTFTGEPRDRHVHEHAHESPWQMTTPLIILGILSVCVAWGLSPRPPANLAETLLRLAALIATAGLVYFLAKLWAGQPGEGAAHDSHGHGHGHDHPLEAPKVPFFTSIALLLVILTLFGYGTGLPLWDASASSLEHTLKDSQPLSVYADFGHVPDHHEHFPAEAAKPHRVSEREYAHEYHTLAGNLALGMVLLGLTFALLTYYYRVMDPAEAKVQFPWLHALLVNKWYFDDAYDVLLVRPAIIVARAFTAVDRYAFDGTIHTVARWTVAVAKGHRAFDSYFVDWLVNLTANVVHSVGAALRGVQTGFLRSYVVFIALGAIALFVLVSFLMAGGPPPPK